MAELPEMQIVDRSDVADWRYQARLLFPEETITLELRRGCDLRPNDPSLIEAQLRSQFILANDQPVRDQARERAHEPVTLFFFE
jgi:hypothetical protein